MAEAARQDIAGYLKQWSAKPDGERMETPASWLQPVRRAGVAAMLKLLKPHSDEQNAAALLRYYDGRGAVRLFEADDNALLMERASGERSLAAMALSGRDVDAADILADTVVILHAPSGCAVPASLTPLAERFRALFAYEATHPLLGQCADMARQLLATEGERVPLHGDLHHYNVLDAGARGWLAIDPKGLIGERTYDVANLLCNPWPHGELVHSPDRMRQMAQLYARRLGLDARRVLNFAFAHAGLSASWDLEDGEDPGYGLRCADVLSPLAG